LLVEVLTLSTAANEDRQFLERIHEITNYWHFATLHDDLIQAVTGTMCKIFRAWQRLTDPRLHTRNMTTHSTGTIETFSLQLQQIDTPLSHVTEYRICHAFSIGYLQFYESKEVFTNFKCPFAYFIHVSDTYRQQLYPAAVRSFVCHDACKAQFITLANDTFS
jgi:hypothetical protein